MKLKKITVGLICLIFLSLNACANQEYWPLEPFWKTNQMQGESVLFVDEGDSQPCANLLFKADKVTKVYQPSTGVVFEEGKDYKYKSGQRKIYLTKDSRIPFKTKSQLYRTPGSPMSIKGCRDGKHDLFFGEGHLFHDLQVEISYVHSAEKWGGYTPSFESKKLAKIIRKLKGKKHIDLAVYGDSISTGANASAKVNVKPFMPSYGHLVSIALESAYGAEIDLINLSKACQVSQWGVDNVNKVIEADPDLVIIAWGMNDGSWGVTPEQYGRNIKAQIEAIRKGNKDVNFILVSTMYGNPEWTGSAPQLYPLYRDELTKLSGDGVVLADVTAIYGEILKHKRFTDITNNGVNHPNDFGHRVYAQTILSLLVGDGLLLKKATEKVVCPLRGNDVKAIELLKDNHFSKGVKVLDPKHGKKIVRGKLPVKADSEPEWLLAQWHSKFDILKAERKELLGGGIQIANHAKSVILKPQGADIVLGLNSIPEYQNKLRKASEPWPHLLVEQNIVDCPALSDLKGLDFNISVELLHSETIKGEGYSKGLHTAHMPFVLVVQNVNSDSKGFNDFMWFLVPVYDDRYDLPQEFIAEDIADPSAKMIYDPGGKRYYSEPLKAGKWKRISYDLLPVIVEALNVAWEKGYLKDSRDLNDYSIVSMNLGWEVTGLNKVEMAIKDLSLKAVMSN